MGDQIHDDVERALAAYGGAILPYRTFGTFSIHPRVPIVTESEATDPDANLSPREAADAPTFYADEAPAAPLVPSLGVAPALVPQPTVAGAAMLAREEPEHREPAPADVSPVAYVPPPPPGYTPAYDPYHGRLPASAVPAALRGAAPTPFVPSYPSVQPVQPLQPVPPAYDPRPAQAPPEPVRRGSELNIFQLAWDSAAAAAPAEGGNRAGPGAAAKDGPLPGAEDLFRRI